MYSIHNEGNPVVAERFIRTLKTKIYKHMTAISKNVYIDKLDYIVNEYYTKTKQNEKKYKTCKSLFKILKEKSKKIYYSRKFEKCKKNMKKTWDTIKQVIGKTKTIKNDIPKIMVIDGIFYKIIFSMRSNLDFRLQIQWNMRLYS